MTTLEIGPETLAKLELLTTKLGVDASQVFEWYVRQQYMVVLAILAVTVIAGGIAFFCKRWADKVEKEWDAKKKADEATNDECPFIQGMLALIGGVISVVGTVAFIFYSVCLLNAEYYAFQEVITTVSKLVP